MVIKKLVYEKIIIKSNILARTNCHDFILGIFLGFFPQYQEFIVVSLKVKNNVYVKKAAIISITQT